MDPFALVFSAGALLVAIGAVWWSRRRADRLAAGAIAEATSRMRRAELLSRHANDVLMLADEQHQVVDVNQRFCELVGYSREEALRLNVRDLRDPATLKDTPLPSMEQVEAGGSLFETRWRRKDGTTFAVEVSVRVSELDGKGFFQSIVRDITERRRLDLQVQLADRMASVATLSGGVAHEINNPLSYVLGNVDYVLSRIDQLPEDLAEVRKALEDARGGAARISQIVRDLRTFSKAGEAERSPVDVRRALQGAVTLAQTEIRQKAQLSLELGPVPPVMGNAHQVGQLFLNLLANAAQAIPSGHPERHLVQATTAVASDGRVRIEIADTGAGIPADVLPRVFDPFFTTRAVGRGIGLGLAIVHGIVTDLGGEVTVRSEPGGGSIFTVLLPPAKPAAMAESAPLFTPIPILALPDPVDPAPRPEAAVAPPALSPQPATPTAAPDDGLDVLVIDDEPMVGRAITRMLVPPHRVAFVGSAAEALSHLSSERFDTILCDLMMPDMTGMALHQKLLAEAPTQAARMVFLTGGAFTQEASEFLGRVPNGRLEKPFTPAQLRAAVASTGQPKKG